MSKSIYKRFKHDGWCLHNIDNYNPKGKTKILIVIEDMILILWLIKNFTEVSLYYKQWNYFQKYQE